MEYDNYNDFEQLITFYLLPLPFGYEIFYFLFPICRRLEPPRQPRQQGLTGGTLDFGGVQWCRRRRQGGNRREEVWSMITIMILNS